MLELGVCAPLATIVASMCPDCVSAPRGVNDDDDDAEALLPTRFGLTTPIVVAGSAPSAPAVGAVAEFAPHPPTAVVAAGTTPRGPTSAVAAGGISAPTPRVELELEPSGAPGERALAADERGSHTLDSSTQSSGLRPPLRGPVLHSTILSACTSTCRSCCEFVRGQ